MLNVKVLFGETVKGLDDERTEPGIDRRQMMLNTSMKKVYYDIHRDLKKTL